MNYTNFSSWGTGITPLTIRRLIFWTFIIAVSSAAIQSIFDQFNLGEGPQNFLSLSWWGMQKWYIWQPLTYLFVQSAPQGITFFYFISLFFNMYLLWVIGSSILEMIGKGPFLRLYCISGIVAGLAALLSMPLTGQYHELAGATPSIIALLTLWSMAYPEAQIYLFFLIPLKAKWIVAAILGMLLLVTFSQWQLTELFLYCTAIIFAYVYAVTAWGWHSPFAFTQKSDRMLSKIALRLRRYTPFRKMTSDSKDEIKQGKVIDMRTGQPLNDDDSFVDAMLSKISKYGESSLSWSEKRRLKQISDRKMQDKK